MRRRHVGVRDARGIGAQTERRIEQVQARIGMRVAARAPRCAERDARDAFEVAALAELDVRALERVEQATAGRREQRTRGLVQRAVQREAGEQHAADGHAEHEPIFRPDGRAITHKAATALNVSNAGSALRIVGATLRRRLGSTRRMWLHARSATPDAASERGNSARASMPSASATTIASAAPVAGKSPKHRPRVGGQRFRRAARAPPQQPHPQRRAERRRRIPERHTRAPRRRDPELTEPANRGRLRRCGRQRRGRGEQRAVQCAAHALA